MAKIHQAFILLIALLSLFYEVQAQSSEKLITDLESIHNTIKSQSCANPQVISNRAMNLFLSDRIGYSLTDYKSLSFYKNYITFNTGDGTFSLNHNFFQPTGTDEPVREFYVVGIKANVANAIISAFTEKPFTNELGVTLKKTWISKPKTSLTNCFEKQLMDSKRESVLVLLAQKIKHKEQEFIHSLASIKQGDISDSDFEKVNDELRQNFYTNLTDEYSREFASLQYQELAETARYKRITTHWTNLSIYLPVILQRFVVANSFALFSENKKAYPFEIALNHTRFWESKKAGRFFVALESKLYLNNSIQSQSVESIDFAQYKNSGGADTVSLRQRNINSIYMGTYQTFFTPAIKLNFIYYPPESHIGISSTLEQNIGTYKALNWTLGIPVVLINKLGAPSANFEFQLRYSDLSHVVFPTRNFSDNITINLTVGVPFSKIIY